MLVDRFRVLHIFAAVVAAVRESRLCEVADNQHAASDDHQAHDDGGEEVLDHMFSIAGVATISLGFHPPGISRPGFRGHGDRRQALASSLS